MCNVYEKKNTTDALKSVRFNSFQTQGPRLFNSVPRDLRDSLEECSTQWKSRLDKFLELIPDRPATPDLTLGLCDRISINPSNSLHDWIPHLGLGTRRTDISQYSRPMHRVFVITL